MLRNKIGPVFNARNVVFFVLFFFFFFEKSSSFCRENEIFENKKNKKNKRIGPVFNTRKKQTLDQFLTLQHIYIYLSFIVVWVLINLSF